MSPTSTSSQRNFYIASLFLIEISSFSPTDLSQLLASWLATLQKGIDSLFEHHTVGSIAS